MRSSIISVKNYLRNWIAQLSVPIEEFGGQSACPYAKMARVVCCTVADVEEMEGLLRLVTLPRWNVLVVEVEKTERVKERLGVMREGLLDRDLIALPSDPENPTMVRGYRTTQREYLLVILQRYSELLSASKEAEKKGYYQNWSPSQLAWKEDRR